MNTLVNEVDHKVTQAFRQALHALAQDAGQLGHHRELMAALVQTLQHELNANRNKTVELIPELELLVRVISSVVRSRNIGEPFDAHYVLDTLKLARDGFERQSAFEQTKEPA